MSRYSAWRVFTNGLIGQRGWRRAWRDASPKKGYDTVIVGGGLHGLASAYYLAKHAARNIAVLEKGWLGGGNAGRNTTIVRSNYMMPGNRAFYERSLKLWENLSHELNYNVMFSQRAHITLLHTPAARDAAARRYNTMRLTGADGEFWNLAQLKREVPHLNYANARFPIIGAAVQPRAGTARHDAVAWGYARAADRLGVDIIQNCEVTGFTRDANRVTAVQTTRGNINITGKVGLAVAGSSSRMWQLAGFNQLPIETHLLQAFVSEPLKPLLDQVVVFGVGGAHFYISQSDKGGLVFGGDIDWYKSYAQRGNLPVVEDVCEGGMTLMPMIGRARMVRMWGGIMDMSMDGSPIIDRTHIDGLYFNGGWCYGGFKATPASGWCFAHLLATDTPHETATAYRMDRFERGYMIDEKGSGAQPNQH